MKEITLKLEDRLRKHYRNGSWLGKVLRFVDRRFWFVAMGGIILVVLVNVTALLLT